VSETVLLPAKSVLRLLGLYVSFIKVHHDNAEFTLGAEIIDEIEKSLVSQLGARRCSEIAGELAEEYDALAQLADSEVAH
jgi:hypothetical protein